MDPETNHQTNHQFRRLPKGERRVRFADSMGMELVSIFLFDLISNYYFASIHNHKQLPTPKAIPKQAPNITPRSIASSPTSKTTSSTTTTLVSTNHISKPTALKPFTTATLNSKLSSSIQHQSNYNYDSNKQSSQTSLGAISTNISNNTTNSHHNDSYNCEFTQPISLVSFKERVKINKVHLETCSVNSRAGNISVSCTIRVLNLSYDKSVIVRYTTDEWHTHTDSLASYKPGSNDGWSDRFTSTFSVTNQVKQFQTGQRILFAVRYSYDGKNVYWDNNGGLNYTVKKI